MNEKYKKPKKTREGHARSRQNRDNQVELDMLEPKKKESATFNGGRRTCKPGTGRCHCTISSIKDGILRAGCLSRVTQNGEFGVVGGSRTLTNTERRENDGLFARGGGENRGTGAMWDEIGALHFDGRGECDGGL